MVGVKIVGGGEGAFIAVTMKVIKVAASSSAMGVVLLLLYIII